MPNMPRKPAEMRCEKHTTRFGASMFPKPAENCNKLRAKNCFGVAIRKSKLDEAPQLWITHFDEQLTYRFSLGTSANRVFGPHRFQLKLCEDISYFRSIIDAQNELAVQP